MIIEFETVKLRKKETNKIKKINKDMKNLIMYSCDKKEIDNILETDIFFFKGNLDIIILSNTTDILIKTEYINLNLKQFLEYNF